MNKFVIVPSAKLVPLELQNEFGRIPTAMIPLDSKPAISYITEYYQKMGFRVLVAAHEEAEQIFDYCNIHQGTGVELVNVGKTSSLGQTIATALKALDELPEEVIINFADTTTQEVLKDGNTVCFACQDDVFRWTTFDLKNNKIDAINEKHTPKGTYSPQNVFIGIFRIVDVVLFNQILCKKLDQPRQIVDPFYEAVQEYFNGLPGDGSVFQKVGLWYDFGHLDTYYATKKALSINCRHFNSISIDERRGTIHKSSENTQKLINEIQWYLKLPVNLQYIAPRIFKYDMNFTNPFMKMEFYGYPALNDMYLHGNYDIGVWNQVFAAIDSIVHDMGTYRIVPEDPAMIRSSLVEMYEGKTLKRLESIRDNSHLSLFFQGPLMFNGESIWGIDEVMPKLSQVLEKSGIYGAKEFSIIHGDLCLSNILYNQRNRLVRLIDPRGSFGSYDIYGDPRYDIAKLCHSIDGNYDFIVNGMFDMKTDGKEIWLTVYHRKRHEEVKALFSRKFLSKWGVEYNRIKLIESLLFLSMVPLHSDRPESQKAFLATGLALFTKYARFFLEEAHGDTKL